MNTARRGVAIAAAALITVVTLSACGGSSDDESASGRVKLAWVPGSTELPILVAQSRGYFEDEGLDVELVKVNSGADAIPLVATGELDAVMASASASMFNALGAGLEFKVVASDNVNPEPTADGVCPSPLVVRKELVDSGEVETVADLTDKKIAVAGGLGTGGAYYLEQMLSEGGVSVTDNTILELAGPDAEAALTSGAVDAAGTYEPFATSMVNSGVAVRLACPPAGIGVTHLLYGETITDQPETAEALYSALAHASRDLQGAQKTSEETRKAVADTTGLSVDDVAKLPLYDYKENLPPLTEVLSDMQDFFREVDTLDYETNLEIDSFVDDSYYRDLAGN